MIGYIFCMLTIIGFIVYVLDVKKDVSDLIDTIYSLELENKLLKREIERLKGGENV